MDRDARRGNHLRDIGVRAEEIIEDRTGLRACLNAQHGFEMRRVNLDVPGVLRVEDGAIEHRGLVVTAVVVLEFGLYLSLLEVLLEEAGELGQFGVIG